MGIARAMEALARPALIVLNYHRIGEPDDYDSGLVEATAGAFDEQMAFLKKRYKVCGVSEALELIENPKKIERPSFLITFDDGYRDNHSTALPILRSHGFQAVYFLTTGYVGTNRIPWWDQIAFMCRRTKRRAISMEYPKKRTFVLDGVSSYNAIREVIQVYKSAATTDPDRFMAQLESACDVGRPTESPERLFMSWD